jgi:ribosome biogenesis GTPase
VVAVDRGRYGCLTEDGVDVVAVRARELGRRGVVVGDDVALVGDLSGAPDALARIVRVSPRVSALRRTADDADPTERVIVANATQLGIVASLADPPPRLRLIDRCLVAAFDAGIAPLLVLTKADLAGPGSVLDVYRDAGVHSVVIGRGDGGRGHQALLASLLDRTSVLVGASGVGKSTLVNALVPGANRRIGAVNLVSGRGRHTSASAVALPLTPSGWLIDTPGVRSFGLAHVRPQTVVSAFPDLSPAAADCPTDCTHLDPEACGLDAWVASGHSHPERLESLRRLLVAR